MKRLAAGLALVLLGGCDDALSERCNERGGIYVQLSALDNRPPFKPSHMEGTRRICVKPDTISLAIPVEGSRP